MNYRAAGRGRSHREFTAKIGTVVEEADETLGWIELMLELDVPRSSELESLRAEASEIVAIFGSSYATAKEKDRRTPRRS